MKLKTYLLSLLLILIISPFALADTRIDALSSLGAKPATDDVLVINDTSDGGTTKSITAANLLNIPNADSYGGLQSAISTIGSTVQSLIVTTDQTLTDNITIPTTLTVYIPHKISISAGSAKVITCKGILVTPRVQILGSNVTIEFASDGLMFTAFPEWTTQNAVPGTTNMTTAINAARATVVAGGHGQVTFGATSYLVSSAITLDHDDVYFIGAGEEQTIITTSSTTADVFTLGAGSTQRNNVGVFHMSIKSSVTKTAGIGVNFNNVKYGYAQHLYFDSMFMAVFMNGVIIHFDYFDIRDTVATTGIAIQVDGGNEHFITNGVIDTSGTDCLYDIEIEDSQAFYIDNVSALNAQVGLYICPGDGETVSWGFVNQSLFDTCSQYGVSVYASHAGATVKGIFFDHSWAGTATLTGWISSGVTSSTVDGLFYDNCKAFNCGQHGMSFGGTSTNFHVSDPIISGNSTSGEGSYKGVDIGADISNWSIKGGKIGQTSGLLNYQQYGIAIASGDSDNYQIVGVDLSGNQTGALLDSGTGTNKLIKDNLPDVETITAASPTLLAWGQTKIDSTDNGVDGTLPDGSYVGQIKTIVMTNATNSSTITVTHLDDVTGIPALDGPAGVEDGEVGTFDAVDESWILMWTGTEWTTIRATCTFL